MTVLQKRAWITLPVSLGLLVAIFVTQATQAVGVLLGYRRLDGRAEGSH